MLERSPLDSVRVLLSAASAMAETSPRNRARIATKRDLNTFNSDFFIISLRELSMPNIKTGQWIALSIFSAASF
jgi:hypothetical protein